MKFINAVGLFILFLVCLLIVSHDKTADDMNGAIEWVAFSAFFATLLSLGAYLLSL